VILGEYGICPDTAAGIYDQAWEFLARAIRRRTEGRFFLIGQA